MEKNVMSLIQQQTEQTFTNTSSSGNIDTVIRETQQSAPSQEEQNASMLNNIGLEVQRQGGI